jgi:cysteine-rich repeat protein
VYRFDVQTARRVRIDTEGSNFKTVLSLLDGAPPQSFLETNIAGNGGVVTAQKVGALSGNSVTDTFYAERSAAAGTSALMDSVAPVCSGTPTTGSNDAYFSFHLQKATHLDLSGLGRTGTTAANEAYNTPGIANESGSAVAPPTSLPVTPIINEFVADHVGADTREYVEIFGQALTNYSSYTILEIEGDTGSAAPGLGAVRRVITVGTTDSSGLWVTPFLSGVLQNGTMSLLLVKSYTGNSSTDIDADDDGNTDTPAPWAAVVDAVAVNDGGAGDATYGSPVLVPNYDGVNTTVGGASRIPSGRDTDAAADWVRNDYDGEGLPGFGFDPVVFLYSSPPGVVTTINAADPNGDGNTSDSNTHINAATALNLGDVFGQVDTKVINADLGNANTGNTYAKGVVSCNTYSGAEPPGAKDQIYKFTPSADGTVRVNVSTSGAAYHAVAIYDGPPPIAGAIGVTQVFDTSKLTNPPDTSCTAYSFDSNKGDAVLPHVYWFCANSRTWSQAEVNCNAVGGHLVRIDDAVENAFAGVHRTATPAWTGGKDTGTNVWTWSDNNDQFWSGGKTGSVVPGRYASWRTGQPAASAQCVAYKTNSGADINNWDSTSCTGSAQYVCEISAPVPAPPDSLASAYPVGGTGDLAGKVLAYTGGTRRMDNDVNGLLMSACGATQNAADAIFRITPSATILATIDSSGSAFPAIVGLFHTTIDAVGYMGCDAPGVAPNSDVTSSSTPASTLPLGGAAGVSLVGGQTYYVVIKGTAASPDGTYQIKFTDLGAGGNGAQIACSMETVTGPAAAQADFSANHTYYVIVESSLSTGNSYAMTVHSLYVARTQVENPLNQNEHGGTAFALSDPYRAKDTVVNTSTAGMAPNFTTTGDTPGGLLTCGSSSAAPDAVYKFTPSISTNVKVSVNMPTKQSVVALFEGQPGSDPTLTDLNASGNPNEDTTTAFDVPMTGAAQTVLGDTSTRQSNIDGTLISCGAAAHGRDVVFRFALPQQTQVQIDASASTAAGKMGDPVIGLFHDFALEKPAAVTLENDSYTDANVNPTPTAIATANWLVYGANMANLSPATQAQLSVAATNTNEQVNPSTLIGAQDLGDVWNTKVTVGGATTAAMQADYAAFAGCGGDSNAPDAIYSFHSSQAGDVRISTATPTPGFNTVVALFDGSTGAPARKIDGTTTTVDLGAAAACGNGSIEWQEECDDGNSASGDGCSSTCKLEPGIWRCPTVWYGTLDGCDCGCGLPDPDCGGITSAAACIYCDPPVVGGCNPSGTCLGSISLTDNTVCNPAACGNGILEAGEQCDDGNTTSGDGCDSTCHWQAGTWHCPLAYLGTNDGCDCGCGLPDPDCANANVSSCGYCGDPGSCGQGGCPGAINPTNNAVCTSFGNGTNSNDAVSQAQPVDLSAGGVREYLGNTATLAHNVDSTLVQCGAVANARDATFSFSLRKSTQVQIDATAPSPAFQPVLALFNSAALSVTPPAQNIAPDSPAEADVNPSPTPQIAGNWVRYAGDTANLTISAQPQTQINNQDNVNNDTPTELVDPINRRDTVTNADTSMASVQATYLAPSCGGLATNKDELYHFVPTTSGTVRISTNYPQTAMHTVIALYDGSNGQPPLTRVQAAQVSSTLGQTHESQPSAQLVALGDGKTYIQNGTTTGMTSDVPAAYLQQAGTQCGAAAGSADAVWSFSLSKTTDLEISSQGTGYSAGLALFDSPFIRPSTAQLSSLADSITQLYDPDKLPSEPDAGCTPYDWNLHRYWFCSQKRTWDGARAKCQYAGSDLVVISDVNENTEMLGQISATAESHHIGLRSRQPYTSWGSPAGIWVDGSSPASYNFWYSNEPNQPTDTAGARMRSQDGAWVDVPGAWQTYRYICEQNTTPTLPVPPTANAPQLVDLFGATRHFVGSTGGITTNSVGNLIGCGAAASAPDAAFRIDLGFKADLKVEFGNSFAGSVIGLFKDAIGVQGYLDAGNVCARVGDPTPQLQIANLSAGTYFVVLTGTASGNAGAYDIRFSGSTMDNGAFAMENDKLLDATNNPIGDITNRWVVKTTDMARMTTDLITARTVDMPGQDTNDSHVAPSAVQDLGSSSGEQITVLNASTAGLNSDYPAPSCGVSAASVDAIYKFKPTRAAAVRIDVSPVGHSDVVALYRGPSFPALIGDVPAAPVTLPNTNDAPISSGATAAKDLGVLGVEQIYLGNVSGLMNDVPTVDAAGRTWDTSNLNGGDALNACNAAPTGKDAFFQFQVTAPQSVVIDSSGTEFGHTLAVWRSTDPLTAPAAASYQYDTKAAATNLPIDNQWYVLTGDTTALMPGGDSKVTKTAPADFLNADGVQDLGVLAPNTQIVTSGADTSAALVHSDYDIATLTCGSAPAANDMIFKFRTGAAGGNTRLTINNPSPAFPPVLALFDGSGGLQPSTAAASDPVPTPVPGNSNDSRANAYNMPLLGASAVAYSGNTTLFAADNQAASLYDTAAAYGGDPGNACNAGPTSKDAFFKLTLPVDTHIRVQAEASGTAYAHTLAIYDSTALSLPATTTVQYDTYAAAAAAPVVTIDSNWLHYYTSMAPPTMSIGGLPETFFAAGTNFQNAAGVQDLYTVPGTISGKQFRTKAASSYAGGADTTYTGATYPAPSCGGVASANDMIFRVRPTTTTKLRVGVDNPAPGFNPMIAVYDGAPLNTYEATTVTLDLAPGGNKNEDFTTAGTYATVPVGSRELVQGSEAAMTSYLAGSQFQAFALGAAPSCNPSAAGPDAFIKLSVRTIPDSAYQNAQLWLDADDANSFVISSGVQTWKDKSGIATPHDVSQATVANRPTVLAGSLNGRSGVDFNGTTQSLVSSAFTALGGERTLFAVWKLKAGYVNAAPLMTTDSAAAGFAWQMSAASPNGKLQYAGVDVNATVNDTSAVLVEVTQDASGITTYKNGTSTASAAAAPANYDIFRIGANRAGTVFAPMTVYEVLAFSKVLSTSERQTVEGYLANKWGLAGSLPGGHPYASTAPTRTVEVNTASTLFPHTVSFFNSVPITRPAAVAATTYDTSDLALASSLGSVNSSWFEKSGSTANLDVSELTQAAGTNAADGATQALGNVSTKEITIASGTESGYAGDYPHFNDTSSGSPSCGSLDSAPDAVYSLGVTSTTTVSLVLNSPSTASSIALYDGLNGPPLTNAQLGLAAATTALAATNETIDSARSVTFPTVPSGGAYLGYEAGFTGDPAVNDTSGTIFDKAGAAGTCSVNLMATAQDAFFTFTVPGSTPREIEINAQGTGGNHTLALFSQDPRNPDKPAPSSGGFASNIDTSAYVFTTSPIWTCNAAGTTTVDSSAGTVTSTSCALGTLDISNGAGNIGIPQLTGGPNVMVIRLRGLTVSNNHVFKLQGNKPIVFLVSGNVVVDTGGKIDAGATTTTAGPGGNTASVCTGLTGGNGTVNSDGGGAGGGGFGTVGGNGGQGSNNNDFGAAGSVSTDATLKPLRGGCAGGTGGGSNNSAGGAGGGAVQISASGTITIGTAANVANVSANGGAGKAQPTNSGCTGDGGDGGGSGGAILLEASATPVFGTNGAARAHGGGGGGGTECLSSNAGADGHQVDDTKAAGGSGDLGANGGAGGLCRGNSCSTTATGTTGTNSIGGGGGGGGGGGRVVARSVVASPVYEKDTAALALAGPYAATDNAWTVKTASLSNLSAEWAVPTTLLESSFAGSGDTGLAPIVLGDSLAKRISIDGDMNTAVRTDNHDEICGADGGPDAVYKITPSVTGNVRVRVMPNGALTPQLASPIVGVYNNVQRAGYQKQITIDGSQVTAALTKFPVLIKLSADANLSAHAAAGGTDIYFVASDQATLLPHEIESYSAGTLVAWVAVDLTSGTDTNIYLRYGDGGPDRSNKNGVWDSSYQAVWHLSNNVLTDSTSNARNGANSGTSDIAGQIGTARAFTHTSGGIGSDYIAPAGSQIPDSTDYTMSLWTNISTAGATNGQPYELIAMSHTGSTPAGTEMSLGGSGKFGFYQGSAFLFGAAPTLASASWAYVVEHVHAASSGGYVEYSINGSAFTAVGGSANTSSEGTTSGSVLRIGHWADNIFGITYGTIGTLDEIHISTALRSLAWSTAEYNNQKSASTFLKTIGAEAAIPTAFLAGYLETCVTDNDTGNQAGLQTKTDSDASANTTTITDLAVTAGKTYYIVVKRGDGSATVAGDYLLELTNKDSEDWAGCNEDLYDGKDGWFSFTTAASVAAGGESYTIETQNSTADTSIALYKDTNGDSAYQASEFMACGDKAAATGYAQVTATVLPSTKYYVRVKQPTGGVSTGTIVLGVRDNVGVQNTTPQAMACADGTSAAQGYAVIKQTLNPGTYFVGWKGGTASTAYTGAYQVNFRDNTNLPAHASQQTCASTAIGANNRLTATLQGGRTYYAIVKGDTAGGTYKFKAIDSGAVPAMTCAGKTADPSAPDGYMAFSVASSPKDVSVDTVGSTLDSVFELWKDNGASDIKIGCAATTGTTTSIFSQLAVGNYYVKVRGTNAIGGAAEQPFQLSMRDEDVQRATSCADGPNTTGTTLTKTLSAGTYYYGLKPQSGQSGGYYQLAVRDTSYNQTGGSTAACTTASTVDVNATANHDYYVLVKGETAADKGSFGLTVTDIGALDTTGAAYDTPTDIGCGELSAPDAYYEFTLASAPKNVEVSITNGFNGAFQLYRDDGSFTNNDNIGSCYTSTHTYALTTTGKYFLVVKGRSVVAGAAEQPLQVSIRDADALGALACADGNSGTPAVIQTNMLPSTVLNGGKLKAGTYYIAFSGQTGQNGPYALMFADQDQSSGTSAPLIECTASQAMTHVLSPNTDYYAIVKGNGPPNAGAYTLSVTDVSGVEAINSSCSNDLAAPDGYAVFTLTSGPRDVRIDMSGSSLLGSFQVFDNAGAAVAGCGCSAMSTPLTCNLAAGTYHVVYRGSNLAGGAAQLPYRLVLQDLSALGSMACADGPASTGTTLTTQTLAVGTYYAGIIPSSTNTATGFNYRLGFKDSASVPVGGAPEVGCSDKEINVNVNANETYYIVVKGKNAGDVGAYGLVVQDLSGVPSFGCNDDTTSGDAFYSFTVSNPAGSNVTIDSEGSSLQTVLALFPSGASYSRDDRNNVTRVCCNPVSAGAPTGACNTVPSCDGKPDDMVTCDASSGVMGTSLINGVHLAPGTYYVVARARLGAPNARLPFVVSVRDDDGVPSNYCSVTASGNPAKIRQVLQPGTYWAVLKGVAGAPPTDGAYNLSFRDYGPFAKAATEVACDRVSDTITQNVTAGKPYYVVVKGDTAADRGPYKLTVENLQLGSGMGCNADLQSPDAFYRFSLSASTQVLIDTQGSALDTVIALYNVGVSYFGTNYATDTGGSSVSCNDDAPEAIAVGQHWSKIRATLPAGDYYLEVTGRQGAGAAWGTNSNPFTVSIRDEGANSNIACAPSSAPSITQTLPAGEYTLVVSDDTGTGGAYDVRFKDLSAVAGNAVRIECDTTNDTVTHTVDANKQYYVIVKGDGAATAKGAYTLNVESIDGTATSMGCGVDPKAPDAFFKFRATQQTDLTLDTVGSTLNTVLAVYPGNATTFGTNYARDAFGQLIGCDDDGGGGTDSQITTTLAPGDYYAVVKGKTSSWGQGNLPFNLSIRDDDSTRAITCANAGSGALITQTLDAGNYLVVLSDTDPIAVGSGGAYSVTFKNMSTVGAQNGVLKGCAIDTLDNGGSGIPVTGGKDYYVVVKGNTATDAGNYTLTLEDLASSQAAAGSTPIACATAGSSIDSIYPAGDYFAVVTGASGANGAYELQVKDVDPFLDYNRIACDAGSGPNSTSVIEANLQPGPHYVVVKGTSAGQTGNYQLNVRDVTANPDNRMACSNTTDSDRITANVQAGKDYTVLLKGDERFEQGNYNIKLYDELNLQNSGGALKTCQVICPNIPPYNSCRPLTDTCSSNAQCCSAKCTSGKCAGTDPAGTRACLTSQLSSTGFTQSLAPDTYYMTVKGRKADEKGFYELQIGDPANGSTSTTKYTPTSWTQVSDAIGKSGAKVLPVVSCSPGSNSGRCDGAAAQARVVAQTSGAVNTSGQVITQFINPDGSGIGSGLAMAVRDLANYLSMNITLNFVNNPGFVIDVQKCNVPGDPAQDAVCNGHFQAGCLDTSLNPKGTLMSCPPGATPKFSVRFTNPLDPNSVPPNPNDPFGGYHFTLQIMGYHDANQLDKFVLDEVPVYIIPTTNTQMMMGPPAGGGMYQTSGTYDQQVFGAGCNYYELEGEGAGSKSCTDGIDNDGDGLIDSGKDMNNDGDILDPGEGADPDCMPGSCIDGKDNDNDGNADVKDPDCQTTATQDWSDLFFKADVPDGTSITFDMCTADDPTGLASCSFSRIATVVTNGGACSDSNACKGKVVNGVTRDGFCGAGQQCQFIDPPKVNGSCTSDAQCLNGPQANMWTYESHCLTGSNQCEYTAPPADIGNHLMLGQNGRPYVRMRVTLNANADMSKTPTLYDWFLQYLCRGTN